MTIMYEPPDDLQMSEQEAAYSEVMRFAPDFMYQTHLMKRQAIWPTGILLPSRLRVPFTGPKSDPSFMGTMLGLPITWAEREEFGVVVHLPQARE